MKTCLSLVLLGVLSLTLSSSAQAQGEPKSWAVGLRLGEPLGLNVRKYLGEDRNHAFDVSVGAIGALWGVDRKYGTTGRYKNAGLAINANYLWIVGNGPFRPFYGFGGQITSRRNYPDRLSGDFEKKIGLGASGLAGFEYFLPSSPVSLFLDLGLYLEVLPVPFFPNVQAGVGVRFNL